MQHYAFFFSLLNFTNIWAEYGSKECIMKREQKFVRICDFGVLKYTKIYLFIEYPYLILWHFDSSNKTFQSIENLGG